MHLHGTPIGGTRQDVARFLMGRHALVPFPRQDDMGAVAECCQSFVFDNGAFSVWKRGEVLDVEGYTRWSEQWHRHPGFEWALIPDVIDGDEADNDALLSDWPMHVPGVPVWHMHEDIGRLERLCRTWPRVALGSSGRWASPGTSGWWGRMVFARMPGTWFKRSASSNVAGAAVDSLLFPTLAFGALMPQIVLMQFVAKVIGGTLWTLLLNHRRTA